MTALTPNVTGHTGLDPLASRYVDIENLAWEASHFPGVDFKTLLVDPETGILTTPGKCDASQARFSIST